MTRFCRKCGAPAVDPQGDRFCGKCGAPFAGGTDARPPAVQHPPPTRAFDPSAPPRGHVARVAPPHVAPHATSQPTSRDAPPPRRRRTGCVVIGVLMALVCFVAGGVGVAWVLFPAKVTELAQRARAIVDSSRGGSDAASTALAARVRVLLGDAPSSARPAVTVVTDGIPALPDGFTRLGPIYDITVPGSSPRDVVVSLPLPNRAVASDPEKVLYVAHLDGGRWEMLTAQVAGDNVLARAPHLSRFTAAVLPLRARPDPGEAARLAVSPPSVWGIRVSGDSAYAELDAYACRLARSPGSWRGVAVPRVRVEVSRADRSRTGPAGVLPSRNAANFHPLQRAGVPVTIRTDFLTQSVPLDLDTTSTMSVDVNDTVRSAYPWLLRTVPLFADGSEGIPSEPVYLYAGVAEGQIKLRAGLAQRIGASGATFLAATAARPYYIIFDSSVITDAYGPRSSMRERGQAILFWASAYGVIGMTPSSEWGRVIAHEWGHYAVHNVLGDTRNAAFPAGAHQGWREAASRSLALSEDLATLLGQWGTGAGVPVQAGAMGGHLTDYSQRPEGNSGGMWPQNRNMDAARVEGVPATVLSRIALDARFGVPRVFGVFESAAPADIVAFYDALAGASASMEDTAVVQRIYLAEGVSWRIRGKVVVASATPGADPEPVDGAEVRIAALNDELLGEESARTGADGQFEITVPPGTVQLRVVKQGLRPSGLFTAFARTREVTNGPPQEQRDAYVMERGNVPTVTITSPAADAHVTDHIATITGTVEGTQNGTPEGEAIQRVTVSVAGQSYDVPLTRGQFRQVVSLRPGDVTVRAVARNDAGEGSAETTFHADIDATFVRMVLTWAGQGTDVDLWVTDPEGVTTGYTRKRPRPGRELDVDDTNGLGPEVYTVTRLIPGTYNVRVNYFRGDRPESFIVRWTTMEATQHERHGELTGTLQRGNSNGRGAGGNRTFTVELAPPPP